jgi:hypothetical protein
MTRFAHAVYCDDIRNEVNGKHSLMGIFGNLMYLGAFPAMLPKLCAVITACTTIDRPFDSITFTGTMDGTVVFEMGLDKDQIEQTRKGGGLIEGPKGFEVKAMIVMSPLHIAGPTKLEITVLADGEKIPCNGLQISQAPEGIVLV